MKHLDAFNSDHVEPNLEYARGLWETFLSKKLNKDHTEYLISNWSAISNSLLKHGVKRTEKLFSAYINMIVIFLEDKFGKDSIKDLNV